MKRPQDARSARQAPSPLARRSSPALSPAINDCLPITTIDLSEDPVDIFLAPLAIRQRRNSKLGRDLVLGVGEEFENFGFDNLDLFRGKSQIHVIHAPVMYHQDIMHAKAGTAKLRWSPPFWR